VCLLRGTDWVLNCNKVPTAEQQRHANLQSFLVNTGVPDRLAKLVRIQRGTYFTIQVEVKQYIITELA